MNGSIKKADLLFNTIRHLSTRQILYRGYYVLRKKWWKLTSRQVPHAKFTGFKYDPVLLKGLEQVSESGPWEQEVKAACERCQSYRVLQFKFINQSVSFDDQINWNDPQLSQLWRYHLHYFDYIQDILVWGKAESEDQAWNLFTELVDSWIASNSRLVGDGWHPFTISVRMVNWFHALLAWDKRFADNPEFLNRYMRSLESQCRVLSISLEHDVRGNHLLKNLRALLWAGSILEGPHAKEIKTMALTLLRQEIEEQILPDGGHFERNPGYHLVVLKDILEIALLLGHSSEKTVKYEWLDQAVLRMLEYLCVILPPQGNIPLLKDTALDASPDPRDILAAGALYFNEPAFKTSSHFGLYPLLVFGKKGWTTYKDWKVKNTVPDHDSLFWKKRTKPFSDEDLTQKKACVAALLPDSGFCVFKDDVAGNHLILDVGKTCPDYLPAHAHADLLSYELIIRNQRVIVDSGVFQYQAGKWRDYFRSSRAHNTVEVHNRNQSQVWGSFRVARRGAVKKANCSSDDRHVVIDAEHDGYLRLKERVIHRRIIVWNRKEWWVIIDRLSGKGKVSAASHVHLNPAIKPVDSGENRWELKGMDFPLWIKSDQNHEARIVRGMTEPFLHGWYSEEFGQKEPNTVLSFCREDSLPFYFGYIISTEETLDMKLRNTGNGGCTVEVISKEPANFKIYPDYVEIE